MSKLFCIIPFFLPLFSGLISSTIEHSYGNEMQFRIIIKKAERKLYLYRLGEREEILQKTYQISLGSNPTGTKRRQGDGATPEGDYYITHKNPRSQFYLSLGLSYPNISDADAGLKAGRLSKRQYEAIAGAIRQMNKPPQNTRLGGDIFIHGGGSGISDWTIGCIALENEEMKELFDLIPLKTPVKIIP
ncbi:MAG: L,D-transpeptidase family protein [Acidobacteria bacterium]|nr:L,D-transpeptidase family protein [Acidobacteriota bacterium]